MDSFSVEDIGQQLLEMSREGNCEKRKEGRIGRRERRKQGRRKRMVPAGTWDIMDMRDALG